jgi:hypothetical protein
MDLIFLVNVFTLMAGGILAVSGLIVAKKPDAKRLIDRLVPYRALIGVVLLGLGTVNLLWWLGHGLLGLLTRAPLFGVTVLALTVTSILLGILFGMRQIAKWMPGQRTVEKKGMKLSKQIAPFQVIIGFIGLGAALLALLYHFRIV